MIVSKHFDQLVVALLAPHRVIKDLVSHEFLGRPSDPFPLILRFFEFTI